MTGQEPNDRVVVRAGRRLCAVHGEPLRRAVVPLHLGHPRLEPGFRARFEFLRVHAPHAQPFVLGAGPEPAPGERLTAEVEHCSACLRVRDANPIERFAPPPVETGRTGSSAAPAPGTLEAAGPGGARFSLPLTWILGLPLLAGLAYLLLRFVR